jgi:hypothetical protein
VLSELTVASCSIETCSRAIAENERLKFCVSVAANSNNLLVIGNLFLAQSL